MKNILALTVISLVVSSAFVVANTGHEHSQHPTPSSEHTHTSEQKQPTIKISLTKQEDKEDKKYVEIKLVRIKNDQPITLKDLKETHTQKIHLLIVDDSLTDYHHIHPAATNEPGVYQFEWAPKAKGNYKLWADLVPVDTHQQQYAHMGLLKGKKTSPQIDKRVVKESTLEGYTFKLSFDQEKIKVGTPTMGNITITDVQGNPVKTLEPIMGAYAHIVGFGEDFQSIVHLHPMGSEPSKDTDRGGPDLSFHLEPITPGFIKLFAQLKIKGKELFVPFGVNVGAK